MNYILFDDDRWNNLLPLTYTRPVSAVRIGILTIKEKWEKYLNRNCSQLTQEYLSEKFPLNIEHENILINGGILPSTQLAERIATLQNNEAVKKGNTLIAYNCNKAQANNFNVTTILDNATEIDLEYIEIQNTWDIFSFNGVALEDDFAIITKGRTSQPIDDTNRCINPENIFMEEGATVQCATLNASKGPIYIGKNAEIMENSAVRGPLALCENATLNMSSKIYGPTTIGPFCKVGGEVNNSVFFGYSNKGHDGFLGNSVLGEWCNLGADTNNSNLKNNYAEVKLWNYSAKRFVKTGLQFCGLIMGDHSKSGINTMFNTGTVVGVNANIFGSGFPRNIVPSYAWGGAQGFITYTKPKAFEVAKKVMSRRGLEFDGAEQKILEKVFELTEEHRNF